jgi:hypothetical protein
MLPSLLVAATISAPAAPIPKDAVPNSAGPAPRVVAVKSDGNGTVWITAQIWEKRKVPHQFFAIENGKQVMKQQEVEQSFPSYIHMAIGEFGAKFVTADGMALSTEEATRRVKGGATLLVTSDGKPVNRIWLRAVDGDTVVMQVEGLAHAHFQFNQLDTANSVLPTTASPRLALFCADETGVVKVAINPSSGASNANNIYYEDLGAGRMIRGRAVVWQGNLEINTGSMASQDDARPGADRRKPLVDVKFDTFDTSGKLVPRSEALKRLRAGGLVLLAGDNRFPDAAYLKAFREEILVLVSEEFVFPQGMPNPYDMPMKPGAMPPVTGAPAQIIRPVPAVGLVAPAVQLRVAPAIINAVPAAPAPKAEVKPEPKPANKPSAEPKKSR